MPIEPTSEEEWKAANDARILAEAKKIEGDPSRVEGAKWHIAKEQEELAEVAEAIGASDDQKKGVNVIDGIPQFS